MKVKLLELLKSNKYKLLCLLSLFSVFHIESQGVINDKSIDINSVSIKKIIQNNAHKQGPYLSPLHWNKYVELYFSTEQTKNIYINNYLITTRLKETDYDNLYRYTEQKTNQFKTFLVGNILVKKNFDLGNNKKQNISYSIMRKRHSGYDPLYGDWEYISINNIGGIQHQGNSRNKNTYDACISCHESVRDRDFVFYSISVKE